MKLITIRKDEMLCLSRWGWHTFRAESRHGAKDYKGRIVGFRILGVGIAWGSQNIKDEGRRTLDLANTTDSP